MLGFLYLLDVLEAVVRAAGAVSNPGQLGHGLPVLTGALTLATVTAFLLAMVPPRAKRYRLFEYRDGFIQVSNREPRLVVMRDADLASLSLKFVSGYDGTYLENCELSDDAGTLLRARCASEQVASHAEQVFAGRLLGPLLDQIDAGLPVSLGRVTVDRAGIGFGKWTYSWQGMQAVHIREHGHGLSVRNSACTYNEARLAGRPNDFLARYVVEHAAQAAGVSVSVS